MRAIFLFFGTWRFHTVGKGKKTTSRSVAMLRTPIVSHSALRLPQVPSMVGLKFNSTGRQMKVVDRMTMMAKALQMPMVM